MSASFAQALYNGSTAAAHQIPMQFTIKAGCFGPKTPDSSMVLNDIEQHRTFCTSAPGPRPKSSFPPHGQYHMPCCHGLQPPWPSLCCYNAATTHWKRDVSVINISPPAGGMCQSQPTLVQYLHNLRHRSSKSIVCVLLLLSFVDSQIMLTFSKVGKHQNDHCKNCAIPNCQLPFGKRALPAYPGLNQKKIIVQYPTTNIKSSWRASRSQQATRMHANTTGNKQQALRIQYE